jgi:Family of unknown function (DUF6527)
MNLILRLWRAIVTLCLSIPGVRFVIRLLGGAADDGYQIAMVEELPDTLRARTLYVLTERGLRLQASTLRPEGCGTVINLNLLPDDHPCWRITVDAAGEPTLHPSVWRREGCCAHFFMRAGRIDWCH